MGIKTLSYPRGDLFFLFFKIPPLPLSSPRGDLFSQKKRPPPGGNGKIGSIPSGNCQLSAAFIMLVVVLNVVAKKLNKYLKSSSVCVCFSEDPFKDYYPRGVLKKIYPPPTFELLPPMRYDRFPQKTYIPPRGKLRGYYGMYTLHTQRKR